MSKIDQLKKVLEIVNSDKASTREIAGVLAQIISAIKKIREEVSSELSTGLNSISHVRGVVDTIRAEMLSKIQQSNDKAYKELSNEVYKLERLIKDVPQFNPDGLESKWSIVIDDLENNITTYKRLTSSDIQNITEKVVVTNERIDETVKDIDVIEEKIKSIELRPVGGRGTSVGIQLYVDGVRKGRVSTVNLVAGSGITLTHVSSGQQNDITISAVSGGGSETPTGAVDGVNTVYTFVRSPKVIIVDQGRTFILNNGFTLDGTGLIVEVSVAPTFSIFSI